MDKALKQRMIGAVVLIALAVIFIPMLLDGGPQPGSKTVPLKIPAPPEADFRSRLLPLDRTRDEPEPASEAISRPAPTQLEPRPATGDSEPADTPAQVDTSEGGPAEAEPDTEQAAPLANWFVQVGSFAEQENALDLRDRLRAAGYTTFVEALTVGGEQIHRVMVGPEMDEARAEATRDEIQSQFGLNGIVVEQN